MRASIFITSFVAVIVGFGGSLAVVLSAAQALNASVAQTSSWVAAICLAKLVEGAWLSYHHRIPVIIAWSTPGAALLAATTGVNFEQAVGAFVVAAVLILLTAAFKPIGVLIGKIPSAIASAMLAGVLFQFVVALSDQAILAPMLVLPLVLIFLVGRVYSPSWAVLAVLVLGVLLALVLDMVGPISGLGVSQLVWVTPQFNYGVALGVGVPLYLVTMASQNLPGFAVLRAANYEVPTRSILAVTGAGSLISAFFGAHTTNMAAITASICTGSETHPDPEKRWPAGIVYALYYGVLGVFGASLVGMFGSLPAALIVTIAGVALTGPLVGALGAALAEDKLRFAAVVTFVVTASGVSAFGIGAAFWGLVAGLAVFGAERVLRP